MADPIILRFPRPATPSMEEFHASRALLAQDPEMLLVPAPGFFMVFAGPCRSIIGCLLLAGITYGLGNIHRNLEFLFYVAGFLLFCCVITAGKIFESLENFGNLRDKHRAYYHELAEDMLSSADYESFSELREGKEARRLYR
jgi:hypothetical protein